MRIDIHSRRCQIIILFYSVAIHEIVLETINTPANLISDQLPDVILFQILCSIFANYNKQKLLLYRSVRFSSVPLKTFSSSMLIRWLY